MSTDHITDHVTGQIDPRSVPQGRVAWSAAFRLRPSRLPADNPLLMLGDNVEGLEALKAITCPSERHVRQLVPAGALLAPDAQRSLVSAFACSIPEWRFAARGTQHVVVSSTLSAALETAAEIYGQFLRDTNQPATQMNFAVERYSLNGSLADISDRELFPACYQPDNWQMPQTLSRELGQSGQDGLIFDTGKGLSAIILNPSSLQFREVERAISLTWSGDGFSRAFDYRILDWRDLAGG